MKSWNALSNFRKIWGQNEILGIFGSKWNFGENCVQNMNIGKFQVKMKFWEKSRVKKWIWESFGSKWKYDKVYGIAWKYEKIMSHKANMRKYGFKCNIENMMAFY